MKISIGMEPSLSNGAAALTAEIKEESLLPNKRMATIKPVVTINVIKLIKKRFLPNSKILIALITKMTIGTNKKM